MDIKKYIYIHLSAHWINRDNNNHKNCVCEFKLLQLSRTTEYRLESQIYCCTSGCLFEEGNMILSYNACSTMEPWVCISYMFWTYFIGSCNFHQCLSRLMEYMSRIPKIFGSKEWDGCEVIVTLAFTTKI